MSGELKMEPVHRVVITGMGALSPAGFGKDVLWEKLCNKESCLSPLPDEMQDGLEVGVAGVIPGYDPVEAGFSKKDARRFQRFVQYAMVASDEAFEQSGINLDDEDLTRFACVFGSGIGGVEIFQDQSIVLNEKGSKKITPLFIPMMISNMAPGNLAIRYGLKGDCIDVVTACATGTHSIGEAYRLIRHGYDDCALAGGTEESICKIVFAGFDRIGALSHAKDPEYSSRPFDPNRDGFVAGEGAGAVILESLEHAKARGADIIAEIVGYGSTGDAYHMTAPEPNGEGLVRSMKQALDEGGFSPQDVSHINAHGTATPINDLTEYRAIVGLVGEDAAKKIPVTSVKGSTGHMLGGAGAVEAVVCAMSVANSTIPPTVGHHETDPECPVYIPKEALRDYPITVALSNSLGFGGHNATLAIAPYAD
ncbi:MAG: beta-ketoacyl-ACP synthase II [Eggerthellaceae bacterium]|nr:beta-ketoacyl-ACP synthase II [Eggerthellaceae bacterium]